MARTCCVAIVFVVGAGFAAAAPYWVAYQGDDFPENGGWEHVGYPPLADRLLEDGALVIDSRANIWTQDYYRLAPGDGVDPDTGEER